MNAGRDCAVLSWNGQHEATPVGCFTSSVEAYGYHQHTCAASSPCATDHFFQPSISWQHSIVYEPDFVNPYQAIQNALRCRSEVLLAEAGFPCNESFQTYNGSMSNLLHYSSAFDIDQSHDEHDERLMIPSESMKKNLHASNLGEDDSSLLQACRLSNRSELHYQSDLRSRSPCTQPLRGCIKTGQSTISGKISSPKFLDQADMFMISEDYSFAKKFSIRHCDLLDWTDKPWQLWMKDKQDRWFRRAPPSEKAVSSCGQPLPADTIAPPIQVARITDNHGRPEGLAPELMPRGPNDQDNAQEAQRIPVPAFLQHLLEMAPVEDEWDDDLDIVFFVRTWFIHHLDHQKCERPHIIELGREWQRWHAEIL